MAEAGSFADRVKQQADIVRVIGEYVSLRKSGQNFMGRCPFHAEKTPSFAVHPVKQIYHCFGCGVGGDVFKFVQEMDKCSFPEAVRAVAEKCGIAVPEPRERTPEERRANQQRSALVEMHREAAAFFAKQLTATTEGKAARAYLEDRGLDEEAIARFGIGYAPSGGESLVRFLRQKYPEKLIGQAGLASHDQGGRIFDRFRRRIMFPIANEGGKIVAFGGRALGDDTEMAGPKYLNSPETPIYTKSGVLFHLDRAKEPIRRSDFAVLVEGYMDTIGVARAGIGNVVASCGTSLTETQVKLLGRFTRRIIVNYDPDSAGQAATERSLALLLEQNFEVKVLALPAIDGEPADPDSYIQKKGAEAYRDLLEKAPTFLDYLIWRVKHTDLSTAERKVDAISSLLPYVSRLPTALDRSEWGGKIAASLLVDEPILRAALKKAVSERRAEFKIQDSSRRLGIRAAERRIIEILVDAEDFRTHLAGVMKSEALYRGLESEGILSALVDSCTDSGKLDIAAVSAKLDENNRRTLMQVVLERDAAAPATLEEAESCLDAIRNLKGLREMADLQQTIGEQIRRREPVREMDLRLLQRKQLEKELIAIQTEIGLLAGRVSDEIEEKRLRHYQARRLEILQKLGEAAR
ncbi:MAG TPA: DNA primase [Candidatus Acidoferrales bacterium]|nr:DNA primase [Candidatus Acidoferrales bacterium]